MGEGVGGHTTQSMAQTRPCPQLAQAALPETPAGAQGGLPRIQAQWAGTGLPCGAGAGRAQESIPRVSDADAEGAAAWALPRQSPKSTFSEKAPHHDLKRRESASFYILKALKKITSLGMWLNLLFNPLLD